MSKLDDYALSLRGQTYVPLVVGGMGVDISTSDLALAIAKLGGIGHISDAMSPWVSDKKFGTRYQNLKQKKYEDNVDSTDKTQVKWDPQDLYQATLKHVESTMTAKRGDGAVFVNVMEKLLMGAPKETLRARLRAALDGGIDGVTLSAGLHLGSLSLIADHPRFRDVNIGIIVSSLRALKLFLRAGAKCDRRPDYIIVEGPLAGGHLGFGLDWEQYSLHSIVKEILDFIQEENLKIPVIPAGGIFTGTDAAQFLEMGASAVQVATRFTISQECGLPDNVKQVYLRAEPKNVIVNMISPAGYAMRMLSFSPCLTSNIRPNCEALGYMLDRDGKCAYVDAYAATGVDEKGRKLPVTEKMCICYHFMKYSCYTCGHYVYRLKDTTVKKPNGEFYLPPAEHIFNDYLSSKDHQIHVPQLFETLSQAAMIL